MEEILHWIVEFVHNTGYVGIFVMTFLESTFLPIPSEITMIPAGYLVYQQKMDFWLVILSSVTGTAGGALLNYLIARKYGRPLIEKYKKYLFLNDTRIRKFEVFFEKHGEISTFTGRLLPAVRHFISIPAGIAKMNINKFIIYTSMGGSLWMLALVGMGYYIGNNEDIIREAMKQLLGAIVVGSVALIVGYMIYQKCKPQE
jgi:membrane protein DedA with SNARE-associated domain